MINEANAIVNHDTACELVAKYWREVFPWVRREFILPNAKVADVMSRTVAGDTYICEVKHTLKQSLCDMALDKYGIHSNYLYLAVAGATEADLRSKLPLTGFPQQWMKVGIIGVYPEGIMVLRSPSYRQVRQDDWCQLAALVADDAGR